MGDTDIDDSILLKCILDRDVLKCRFSSCGSGQDSLMDAFEHNGKVMSIEGGKFLE
jgi:hypothetical protein